VVQIDPAAQPEQAATRRGRDRQSRLSICVWRRRGTERGPSLGSGAAVARSGACALSPLLW